MIKLITKAELEKRDDILPADKELVEERVHQIGGYTEDPPDLPAKQAIRGFLVGQLVENVVDDALRSEFPADAARFSEGWDAAVETSQKYLEYEAPEYVYNRFCKHFGIPPD